ncbi:hypothetical protein H072_7797 [Dactylellina haptotyla CBS 200.50]|uniref:ER membrane protein complex subunit 10 n=1 Tax=Dactylellina haptotyla (strain CBS 200.50) TaxID=1284197 RepID=S8BTA1_DACHA|nr:hypothetical protein H072_7797 [Dactylellina haptotyla CBS 200.50]
MRFLSSLLVLLAAVPLSLSAAGDGMAPENFPLPGDFDQQNRTPPQTYVLNSWPLSAGDNDKERVPLGMIRYVASTLSASFTPMIQGQKVNQKESYRVGVLKGGKWIGTVRDSKVLQSNVASTITLHVDEAGEIFHIEFDAVEIAKGEEKPEAEIIIIRPFPGAQPVLNKPVVLMPDGKMAAPKEEEKTFLQKYWWVLVAGALLLAAAPGEPGK